MDVRELIARRISREFKDGMLVNLGVGIPTLIPNFLPPGVSVWLESENGIIGFNGIAPKGEEYPFFIDASKAFTTIRPGGCIIDSTLSFGVIRGGHLDCTVLGALQVDEEGNLANWIVPGGRLAGMGGAMDLVTGAKKVIIATEHCSKDGKSKILKKCTFPLTGIKVVDIIVTDMAYIEVTDKGLVLKEVAPGVSVQDVVAKTEASLIIPPNVPEMNLN
ncbi:MAG: Acetate CoA-transferase subunit beta [Smithella sp. PtaU1.Bin162]|nr:MAG: Acetate CoA-transferase subunit beta [Smithella sp. PtaU1.Bin162]